MKRKLGFLVLALLMAALLAACAPSVPEMPVEAETTVSTTAAATAESETSIAPVEEETTAATEETTAPAEDLAALWEARLEAIKEQAKAIEDYLEHEAVTQADLNGKAQELYVLWDTALNELWADLEDTLPEDEFDLLLDQQLTWIDDKEAAVKEAGKDVEGGSMYPLITNAEAAAITEQRVYELFELLK